MEEGEKRMPVCPWIPESLPPVFIAGRPETGRNLQGHPAQFLLQAEVPLSLAWTPCPRPSHSHGKEGCPNSSWLIVLVRKSLLQSSFSPSCFIGISVALVLFFPVNPTLWF